ncbi:MAG: four helix bundle protein [Patescibacteria group bacterium]|jgi:four helix bundle protein
MLNDKNPRKYDLEDRTAIFGQEVIKFCQTLPVNTISKPIITQIIRSATSIGANYLEANGASSKKDFLNKIFICKKESQETKHWLKMLVVCFPNKLDVINNLLGESQELSMIFHKISQSTRNGSV